MLQQVASTAPDEVAVAAARQAFVNGEVCDLLAVRREVREAWSRSRTAGVDPELKEVPVLLEGPSLQEHLAGHELYQAGLPTARGAAALLEGTGCALFLTDEQGIVLYAGGDRTMLRLADRVGSLPGASWREDLAGNNAVGTSLVTGGPVHFRAAEHWASGWGDWACFAAPVRDRQCGSLLGTVALVSHWKAAEAQMLPWVVQVAGSLVAQVEAIHQARIAVVQAQASQLQRWFPQCCLLAVAPGGRIVWTAGPLPAGLPERLGREHLPAPHDSLLAERVLALSGASPSLVIPIRQGEDLLGHVIVIQPEQQQMARDRASAPQKVVALRDGRALLFNPQDVFAVFASNGRVQILTETGLWATPYHSLEEAASRVPTESFVQVDRGTLVNLDHVREIHPMFNRTATLILSDRQRTAIPVSRRRTAALRNLLGF